MALLWCKEGHDAHDRFVREQVEATPYNEKTPAGAGGEPD